MGFQAQPSNRALADAVRRIRKETDVPHAIVAIAPAGKSGYHAHLICDVSEDGRRVAAYKFNGQASRRDITGLLGSIRKAVVGGALFVLLEGEVEGVHAGNCCRRSWRLVDDRLRTRKKGGERIEFPFNPV